jgi:soluble P-type ATPase
MNRLLLEGIPGFVGADRSNGDHRNEKKYFNRDTGDVGDKNMKRYEEAGLGLYYNYLYMIELLIPGRGVLQVQHLVSDVNGTLALDGRLIDGVSRLLSTLRGRLEIHLITADTHGQQAEIDRILQLEAVRLRPGSEAEQKAAYVSQLGEETVIAIGQGANDALMLQKAAIGICVFSREGTAVPTLLAADLVVPDILSALELLDHPLRMVASLRK